MKINIYSPTYYRLENTIEFVTSLKRSVARSKYDTKVFIADNNSPAKMKTYLRSQEDENFQIHLFEKNYGKGHAINTLHNNVRKCELVLSMDSDIICMGDINWIDRLANVLQSCEDIGIISARFQDGVSHDYRSLKKKMTICGSKLIYGTNGIGGACMMVPTKLWDKIGGYQAPDIYAGDDGSMISTVLYKIKKKVVVCTDVELFHLDENDDEYRAWKLRKMHNPKTHCKKPNTGYYENL